MTKLDKILNKLNSDVIAEMQAMSPEALKTQVVVSEQVIDKTKTELEENAAYQQLKEDLGALSAGYKELKKFQGAKIQYALVLLSEKGQ